MRRAAGALPHRGPLDNVLITLLAESKIVKRGQLSDCLLPQEIIPEAYVRTKGCKDCVPRQLAALTGIDRCELDAEFDGIFSDWRKYGVTPEHVIMWCARHRRPVYVAWYNQLIYRLIPEGAAHEKGVAFCVWGDHAYFYRNTRAVAKLEPRPPANPSPSAIDGDNRNPKTTDVRGWQEWSVEHGAGKYWCACLEEARKCLLSMGHKPKVTVGAVPNKYTQLYVNLGDGAMTIHSWPREHEELRLFAEFLQREHKGLKLTWHGRGVATATLAALTQPEAAGQTFELGGPDVMSFRAIMTMINTETRQNRRLIEVPAGIAQLMGKLGDILPFMPMTSDQYAMLQKDNVANPALPGLAALGIAPTPMAAFVPAMLERYRPGGRFHKGE